MNTDDLDYPLPADRIAATPAKRRDQARLMVVRPGAEPPDHRIVADLPQLLCDGDLLILNDTRVLPARFSGRRDTGGKVTGLFVETRDDQAWTVLLECRGRLKPGERITLTEIDHVELDDTHELELIEATSGGAWIVARHSVLDTETLLDAIGAMPLPPYIAHARKRDGGDAADLNNLDRRRYQTVYAAKSGAVAAPTAGLHFTQGLLEGLTARGITIARLTLHVGLGTFAPVRSATLDDHPMHAERFTVPAATLAELAAARREGRRIIPVGTTCVRALESLPDPLPQPPRGAEYQASTTLMIQPGYGFRFTDGLMTNFHLPRSTLLALVSALTGLDRLKALYQIAVDEGYRFYSYGDAMLILP